MKEVKEIKKVKKELNDLMMCIDEAQEAIKTAQENQYDRVYCLNLALRRLDSAKQEVRCLDDKKCVA